MDGASVASTPAALEARGLTKRYGQRTALAPLNLTVNSGESVAVVGPSGSGKTTLLHMLVGVLQADAGSVRIGGVALPSCRRERARLVGVMHQQFDLVPGLAVIHNVLAGNLGRWGLPRALLSLLRPLDVAGATAALRRVGLADRLYERTGRLSGGEQQRVALARLLVQGPRVLLADEPVSSLDPVRAQALVELLVRMAAEDGHALIVSLHSVQLAVRHFDRIVALRDGQIVFDRPARDVTDAQLEMLYAQEAADAVGTTADAVS